MNLTVITPVLNGGTLLRGCMESVRRERCYGETVEHIILDGGSTDGSVALARSQGAHVIERPDLGLYERLNLGFTKLLTAWSFSLAPMICWSRVACRACWPPIAPRDGAG